MKNIRTICGAGNYKHFEIKSLLPHGKDEKGPVTPKPTATDTRTESQKSKKNYSS